MTGANMNHEQKQIEIIKKVSNDSADILVNRHIGEFEAIYNNRLKIFATAHKREVEKGCGKDVKFKNDFTRICGHYKIVFGGEKVYCPADQKVIKRYVELGI